MKKNLPLRILTLTLARFLSVLALVLCLSTALTSCLYYPDTEDGELQFDSTFYDTYFVEDYNLRYWVVNHWEDTIRATSDEEPPHCYWNSLRVATIPDTDSHLFVSGIREQGPFIGGPIQESFIYQSKDAPIPRKEWTIAEIRIFPGTLGSTVSTSSYTYKTHYRDWVENAEILYSWTEEGADPVLYAELQDTLRSAPFVKKVGKCVETAYKANESDRGETVVLCVTFQENPNIAWFATVYVAPNGYFLGRVCHDRYDSVGQVDTYYAMGKSWNQLLEKMLHGLEQFETDTAA